MMRRADRLLKLVHYLRRMRRAVTAQKIAEDFGVCKRTIYRDIQDLICTGVPISGEAGVGYVIDKKYYLPPVMFERDELEAIGLGVAMVRSWTDDEFASRADSALDKVQAVLPAELCEQMQQLTTWALPSASRIPWTVSFTRVRECIRDRYRISITYTDLNDTTTRRKVRPLALVFFGPVWLLVAWCEKRRGFRNFRLDRISQMEISKERFKDEKDKNLQAYIRCVGQAEQSSR